MANGEEELPRGLKRRILNDGAAMEHFYSMPTEKRQDLLDSISETNKKLRRHKKTAGQ